MCLFFSISCQSRGIEMASMECDKLDKKEDKIKCKEALNKKKSGHSLKQKKSTGSTGSSSKKNKHKKKKPPHKEFYNQALFEHWSGNYHQAILLFKKSIQHDASYAPAHYKMGNTYASLNQFHDALQAYDAAVTVSPKLYEAHYNSGLLYKQQFNYRAALESFKKAVEAKSVFPKAHMQIGKIYETLNEKDNAIKHYKAAFDVWDARLKKNPNYFLHQMGLERLYDVAFHFLERESVIKRKSSVKTGKEKDGVKLLGE